MAKRSKQPVNKSAFVRDFITQNPEANRKAVEEAWLSAGHDGVISSALVSNLRREMGLTGSGPRQAEAKVESAPTTKKSSKPKGAGGKRRAAEPEQAPAEGNGTPAVLGSRGEPTADSGDRPIATGRGGNQGKTAFVTEHLGQNPQATDDEIREAWASAGNEGGISGSLIYKIRAKEGLTGRRGAKGRGAGNKGRAKSSPEGMRADRTPEPVAGTPKPLDRRTNRGRVVAELEGDIDRLIFKLMAVGGLEEIEDELRKVRRRLILGQGE
jgi:hypothetical protein